MGEAAILCFHSGPSAHDQNVRCSAAE